MAVRVADLGCDLMTLSGHKIGGPAGIGALYVRPGLNLSPKMLGGPQESGLRAGTPNLIGAIGFGVAAAEVSSAIEDECARIAMLSEALLKHLLRTIPDLRLNGPLHGRVANTLNLTFPGVLGESMLIALDLEGVEVSMGSACAAGAVEPSHVLTAMGRSAAEARSSLRISLGWSTTAKEIAHAAEIIPRVWRRVCERRASRRSGGSAMSARVLVAMSGGVDSSVAAALLHEQGYDVVGIAMRLDAGKPAAPARRRGTCCSYEDFEDARRVAERMDFPFYVIDLRADFAARVIGNFVCEYLAGRTPNPCVMCNREIKFDRLWSRARALEADFVATGHYAQIARDADGKFPSQARARQHQGPIVLSLYARPARARTHAVSARCRCPRPKFANGRARSDS